MDSTSECFHVTVCNGLDSSLLHNFHVLIGGRRLRKDRPPVRRVTSTFHLTTSLPPPHTHTHRHTHTQHVHAVGYQFIDNRHRRSTTNHDALLAPPPSLRLLGQGLRGSISLPHSQRQAASGIIVATIIIIGLDRHPFRRRRTTREIAHQTPQTIPSPPNRRGCLGRSTRCHLPPS